MCTNSLTLAARICALVAVGGLDQPFDFTLIQSGDGSFSGCRNSASGDFLVLTECHRHLNGVDGTLWKRSARPCLFPCAALTRTMGQNSSTTICFAIAAHTPFNSTGGGRTTKKDDNAHIEQKNWTHVRRLLGYVRYDSEAAREAIDDLCRIELCLFQNPFLPSLKLEKKERNGSHLRRHYEAPQTPCQRVAASPVADPERVAELHRHAGRSTPFSSRPPFRRSWKRSSV
jgi:hypothetical protein